MENALILLFVIVILVPAALAGRSAAPWVPTKARDRNHLLQKLNLKPGMRVVDLGCGDGSLLFGIARQHPEVVCVGYDISTVPLLMAWTRKILFWRRYRNVHIRVGNLFTQELKDFDVIFIFLMSKCYPRLMERLKTAQLKPSTTVVTEAWPLPNLEAEQVLSGDGLLSIHLYSGKQF